MDEDLYAQKLAGLKRNESPEAVLLVADDSDFMKIIVAWASLDVRTFEQPSPPTRGNRIARYGTGSGPTLAIPSPI